jgi:hypothetical protein
VQGTFTSTTGVATAPDWTVLTPSADSRLIYVDATLGNNNTAGPSGNSTDHYTGANQPAGGWEIPTSVNAYQTVAQGIAQLRDGFPDYLLFKKGETWYASLGDRWVPNGRSASEPMVVSAYGTGSRPEFRSGNGPALGTKGSTSPNVLSYLVFKGLRFYSHTRDPNNVGEYAGTPSIGGNGIDWFRGAVSVTFEDLDISFYQDCITMTNLDNFATGDIKIRYNVLHDTYNDSTTGGDHSQGIFLSLIDGALIEGNIIHHCGWNEDIAIAYRTQFNHGIYIVTNPVRASRNVDVINNILSKNSANGAQLRIGGLLNGNLAAENANALLLGNGQADLTFMSANDNVMINSNDIQPDELRGWGLDWGESAPTPSQNAECRRNLCISRESANPGGISIQNVANVIYEDNIIHDWSPSANTNPDSAYVDPNRNLEGYDLSVGGLGTRANYYAQLLAQSQDTWNPNYSVENIRQYFIDGYTLL